MDNSEPNATLVGTPRINTRVLLISAVALAVLAPTLYFVRSWQVSRSAPLFLQEADRREKAGEYMLAAMQVENYLRVHPQNVEARIRLADLLGTGAKTPPQREKAIEAYRVAMALTTPEESLRLRRELTRLLMENRKYFEAHRESKLVLEKHPLDPAMLRWHALAAWRLYESGSLGREKFGETPVVAALELACEHQPRDIELHGYLLQALRDETLARDENPEWTDIDLKSRADAALERLLVTRERDAEALLLRYEYRSRWNESGAKEDLREASERAPKDRLVMLTLATDARRDAEKAYTSRQITRAAALAEAKASLERAVGYFRALLEEHPDDPDPLPRLALGETLQQLDRKSEAAEVFQVGIEKHEPKKWLFQGSLANVLLEMEEPNKATALLEELDRELPKILKDVPVVQRDLVSRDQALRRGIWHMLRREPRLAIPFLSKATTLQESVGGESKESVRAQMLLGYAYTAIADWGESAAAFDRAAARHPNLVEARLAASTSWLSANRPDMAAERAEQALRLSANCRSLYALALALYQQQAMLVGENRVWQRFEQTIREARQKIDDGSLTDPWRIDLLFVDFLFLRSTEPGGPPLKQEQVIRALQRLEEQYPQAEAMWALLPGIYQKLGLPQEAEACISRVAKNDAVSRQAPLAHARLRVQQQDYAGAQAILQEASKTASADDLKVLQSELANVLVMQRDYAGARQVLEPLVQAAPADLPLLRRIADIDLELGNVAALDKWRQQMRQEGSSGDHLAHYFRIMQLLRSAQGTDDPKLVEALAEQEKLVASRPTWTEAVALRGLIEQRRGRAESAVLAYEQAITMGEQRIAVFEQLVALLEGLNRAADAEKYLARLKSHVPFSQTLTAFESSIAIRRDQPQEALAIARRGVEHRPQDASARLWLARLLLLQQDTAAAEQEFLKAVQLAPQDTRTWNGLFSYYVARDRIEEARGTLDRLSAASQLPPAELQFVLAQGYELLRDFEAATRHYEAAVKADPRNENILLRQAQFFLQVNPDEAEKVLRQLLALRADHAAARRALAQLLATRGRGNDWDEAEQLLSTAKTTDAAWVADNRLQAVLLAQRGGNENLGRAVKIMEELNGRAEFVVDADRLVLAQLYERQARLATEPKIAADILQQARARYVDLCAKSQPQAGHVIAFIDFLQRNKLTEEAGRWLDTFATTFLEQAKPQPAWLADQIRQRIVAGQLDKAESWLEKLEALQPDHFITIQLRSQLLAQRGEQEKLRAYLDAKAQHNLTQAATDAQRLAVYRSTGGLLASLGEMENAEKWFRRLEEAQPSDSRPLIGVLATQGKLSAAVETCRKGIEQPWFPGAMLSLLEALVRTKPTAPELAAVDDLIGDALRRHGNDVRLVYGVATWRTVQGRADEAITLFRKVLELNPRHAYALNNLAMMLAEQAGDREEALRYIDQAIGLAGSEPALYDTKGTILIFAGRAADATEFLEAAVASAVEDPRFRFHLALAYRMQNNDSRAREELQRALDEQLEKQVLTPLEQSLLTELRTHLKL